MNLVEINTLIEIAEEHFRRSEAELPPDISSQIYAIAHQFEEEQSESQDLKECQELLKITNSLISIAFEQKKRLENKEKNED